MPIFLYNTYRNQLAIAHPALGHAMWEPGHAQHFPPTEVGDVGFIREGRFTRLFNALLPEDDPAQERWGVPEDHEPLHLPSRERHVDRGTLLPKNICSYGVVATPGRTEVIDTESEPGTIYSEVSFSFTKKQGAALSLPVPSRRQDTLFQNDFRKWIIAHIDSWLAFTQCRGMGVKMEDIVLVTGCHRTSAWANLASDCAPIREGARASFAAYFTHAGAHVHLGVLNESIWGATNAYGTQWQHPLTALALGGDLPPEPVVDDQCIFIRGFRVKRNCFGTIKRIRAAAEPKPDQHRNDHEPDMEGVRISAVPESQYQDPLHQL
ncbi:hypothetical protein EI94DRAFT_1808981 [Lactarius quietus]|nr:hypothetical protein EI94DRAFT_1808981 [Lactarius quietus]